MFAPTIDLRTFLHILGRKNKFNFKFNWNVTD